MIRHFWGSWITLLFSLGISFWFWGAYGLYIVSLLILLEISLSFDNAVVNAKVLSQMDPVWQKRFIVWGIPIAVFGMRFVLPVLLVAMVSSMTIVESFTYAINDPARYKEELESGVDLIHAFGGGFLLMVAMSFYFDENRKIYWIKLLENNRITQKLSTINTIELIVALIVGIVLLLATKSASVGVAFFVGIAIYEVINQLDSVLSSGGTRHGVAGFVYLEILDASFSLDGVVGAFALSSNIYIIMIGLGVGAIFVRSLTLMLVRKEALSDYRFLEHGAHYAIFALAVIMFGKIFFEVSEIVVGSLGAIFILLSFWHSLIANKRDS